MDRIENAWVTRTSRGQTAIATGAASMRVQLLALTLIVGVGSAKTQDSADDLAQQATDPTASLMAFNFSADYTGNYNGDGAGQDDNSVDLSFRPAIPFTAFGRKNILRLTVPYRSSGRGAKGLGTVSVFDVMLFDRPWGRFALGGVAALSQEGAAPDEFAIGPAAGVVWQYSKTLNLGVFSQNIFAGDTAISQIQPIIAYQIGNGWSLSAGDLQWAYDFKNSRWQSFPIGFQVGKVSKIGKQPVRYAFNPQYNLVDFDGSEGWSVSFTFAMLVPGS
jgi:hypothetical protein